MGFDSWAIVTSLKTLVITHSLIVFGIKTTCRSLYFKYF